MNTERHLALLILILTGISLWLFIYKITVLKLPLSPQGQSTVWIVEANITFEAEKGRGAKVDFLTPPPQAGFAVLDETFVSKNYGVTVHMEDDNRLSVWTIRHAPRDQQSLYYRSFFYADPGYAGPTLSSGSLGERYEYAGIQKEAAETIISNARAQSVDSFTFANNVINSLLDKEDGNAAILLDRNYSVENITSTASRLLRGPNLTTGPNIITRPVQGLKLNADLSGQANLPLQTYLGVWDAVDTQWRYINPLTGKAGLPRNFLIWQYGNNTPMLTVEGGENAHISYAFTRTIQNTLDIVREAAISDHSRIMQYSLFNLPVQTQEVYQALVMVPLGALIILMLRSLIGIVTFGTFMPVLIALAFRETQLLQGIFLFTLIVSLGLTVRFYLENLKLLLIPRLGAILSAVILLMMGLTILSNQLGLQKGLSIALFPMVILTMIIERMSIVWEERNPWEAIRQGLGSLLGASLAYLAMSNVYLEHLMFVFPELMLTITATMLLLGRYHGYRLSELIRFKALADKDHAKSH